MENGRQGIFRSSGKNMVRIISFYQKVINILASILFIPFLLYMIYHIIGIIFKFKTFTDLFVAFFLSGILLMIILSPMLGIDKLFKITDSQDCLTIIYRLSCLFAETKKWTEEGKIVITNNKYINTILEHLQKNGELPEEMEIAYNKIDSRGDKTLLYFIISLDRYIELLNAIYSSKYFQKGFLNNIYNFKYEKYTSEETESGDEYIAITLDDILIWEDTTKKHVNRDNILDR